VRYQRKDAHYRRAKAEGFRARSAYKLAELDDRHRLLHPGDRVVDLGAWPGGWLQVAAERVGPRGRVVGIDLKAIDALPARHVDTVVGDVRDPTVLSEVVTRAGGPADVVLSDLAPSLTGVRDVDEARCAELHAALLEALPSLLAPGGRALVKTFMDPSYAATLAKFREVFSQVRTTRPDASRRGSAELYVLAKGFRPPPTACG
jgi:23S rRNA (uridine2552-2'-O)-methyltransferase